ncbi:Uncharacterised protein [Acinetobacter baumannii]|nr:Uncharacterised protein [Acinetobacter baumannii]
MFSLSLARFCTTPTARPISLARAWIAAELLSTICLPWCAAWSAWLAASAAWVALRATSWAVAVISWTAVATSSISASCCCTPWLVRMAMSAVCSEESLTFCTDCTTWPIMFCSLPRKVLKPLAMEPSSSARSLLRRRVRSPSPWAMSSSMPTNWRSGRAMP